MGGSCLEGIKRRSSAPFSSLGGLKVFTGICILSRRNRRERTTNMLWGECLGAMVWGVGLWSGGGSQLDFSGQAGRVSCGEKGGHLWRSLMGVYDFWQGMNVKHKFCFVCCGLLGFQGDRENICLMSRLACEIVETCTNTSSAEVRVIY